MVLFISIVTFLKISPFQEGLSWILMIVALCILLLLYIIFTFFCLKRLCNRRGGMVLCHQIVLFILAFICINIIIIDIITDIIMMVTIRHRRSRRSLTVTLNQELLGFTVPPGLISITMKIYENL